MLVVDDDPAFRALASRVLVDAGYAVAGEAGTVDEALARVEELRPNAALVDVGLPDGDGFALAEELVARPHPIRVVLISADAGAGARPAAVRAGACGFLPKSELSGPALRQFFGGD